MPAVAPSEAHSLQPIRVFVYPPTPAGITPNLPDALVEVFLHELSQEPHHNRIVCNICGKEQTLALHGEGTSCTQRSQGRACQGVIIRDWTPQKAHHELLRLLAQGGVSLAWQLTDPSVPVALAVCEAHHSNSVIRAIDFPMSVLSTIYSRFDRGEPFLAFTHLSVAGVSDAQRVMVLEKMIKDASEMLMRRHNLTQATVLVPVSTKDDSIERRALQAMLDGKQTIIAHDERPGRHRELWGFKFRTR